MTACMQRLLEQRVKNPPQQTMPLVHKINFKQIVEVLF